MGQPDELGAAVDRPGQVRTVRIKAPRVVDQGAGIVLGVLFYLWVVLPFLDGGTKGVRDVIRAKFLNKAPDGTWLP